MIRAGVVAIAMLVAMPAHSEDVGRYFGVMAGITNYQEPSFDFDMPTATLRLGKRLSPLWGGEVRGAMSGKGHSTGTDMQVDYLGSALLRLNWRPEGFDNHLVIYGLGGITYSHTTVQVAGTDLTAGDTTASLGAGIELFGDERNGIGFEFIRYADSKLRGVNYTLDGMAVSYVRRF